jgi:hypothetical protein
VDAALSEHDPSRLAKAVADAEDAIFWRLIELNGISSLESDGIARGTAMLRDIQVKRLNFPRWKGEET